MSIGWLVIVVISKAYVTTYVFNRTLSKFEAEYFLFALKIVVLFLRFVY